MKELSNPLLDELGDAAVADGLAFTTDSFVVKPLFFPGGDIGELAVNGTVNDLAVAGAEPLWLSAGFVIEEGFPLDDLRRIARFDVQGGQGGRSRRRRRRHQGGRARKRRRPLRHHRWSRGHATRELARPAAGDRVLLSGTLGDHGFAVLVARGDLKLETHLESDTAPLTRSRHWAAEGPRFAGCAIQRGEALRRR